MYLKPCDSLKALIKTTFTMGFDVASKSLGKICRLPKRLMNIDNIDNV